MLVLPIKVLILFRVEGIIVIINRNIEDRKREGPKWKPFETTTLTGHCCIDFTFRITRNYLLLRNEKISL